MKKILILLISLSSLAAAQVRTLTLEESLWLALEKSKSLKIADSKLKSADARSSEVFSTLLPKVNFTASYARLSDIPPFEVTVPFSPKPIVISEPILNNYQLKLSLQQPLFTGFRLLSLNSAAKLNKKAFEEDYSFDKNNEALTIINAFYNFYKLQQMKNAVDETLTALEAHLADTKNFLDNGLVTNNDYLKIEVQVYSLRLKKLDVDNSLKMAAAMFNKAIALPIDETVNLVVNNLKTGESETDFNTLISEAKEKRNDLKSVDLRIEAGEASVTAARAGWFPSVFLFSNYYYNRPNQRIMPSRDQFDNTWDVGVTLSWEVWNWGATSAQTEQAEQNVTQLKLTREKFEDGLEIEVYNNYLKLISSKQKIDLTEKSLIQAEENYRTTKEKFNVQLATSTDLLDAEAMLLQNKTDAVNALVEYELSKAQLNKSVGRQIY